jgi:enoyl-CoA hydratase/carnithine racemase
VACTALACTGRTEACCRIDSDRTSDQRQRSGGDRAGEPCACRRSSSRPRCDECLEHLLNLSPASLAVTKKAVYAWDSMHFDKGLARAEKIYLEELMKTADAQEGIRAFMEKRKPHWTGK